MNTNRDVILVDLSNIRDPNGEMVRTDRGRERAVSRSYLEGFEAALRSAAPYAHIVLVAGLAIVSEYLWVKGGKRQSTDFKWMKRRTRSKGEANFVYLMQVQKDGEKHLKADELILHIARHYDGFIVSNDNYRELEYYDTLREVGHKHFDPKYDHPSDRWSFERKLHDQVDLTKHSAGHLLEECLTSLSILDQEEEKAFGQRLYHKVIPDFWADKDNVTVGGQNRITQKLSFASARVVKIRPGQIAGTKASVMKGLSAFGIPLLRREQISNQFVELFGRTKTYDDQIFLEGIPGDKAVLLEGCDDISNPNTGFLQITGKLRFEDNQAILKRKKSLDVVEIGTKQAIKLAGTSRVMNLEGGDHVQWVMKPLPWKHRKIRASEKIIPDVPPIEVKADEPKIDVGKVIIGEPLIQHPRASEGITSDSEGDGDSRSKLMIVVALAVISAVAGLWLSGASVDNGCQDSNSCVEGSNSPAPVLDPARTKWIWHSREKIWVRE